MPDNLDNIDSLEIIVRDQNLPAPKAGGLGRWVQERLEQDAIDLYRATQKALQYHLKPRKDKEGKDIPPSLKAVELAMDALKMRDPGGININQNFGGNTTINNNGTAMSFEDLVKRQQARDKKADDNIIDAEVIESIDVNQGQSNPSRG